MATYQERMETLFPGDAPLVQIVDYLIDEAIKTRASDTHIEP
jgi:type II secretory ATPase GspE/PulE/Tfp pilus assembly ATPase PilB-like protein